MGPLHVGMAGWTYEPWRGPFYPDGLRVKQELAYASRKVRAVEVNGTFYALLRSASYASWYEQTPAGFVFALKGPKYLTHVRRLENFEEPLANFLASGPLALKEKLGPILWQFAPNMPYVAARFEPFLAALARIADADAARFDPVLPGGLDRDDPERREAQQSEPRLRLVMGGDEENGFGDAPAHGFVLLEVTPPPEGGEHRVVEGRAAVEVGDLE